MNNTNNQHHHHHHLNLFIYSEVSWYVYDRIAHRYRFSCFPFPRTYYGKAVFGNTVGYLPFEWTEIFGWCLLVRYFSTSLPFAILLGVGISAPLYCFISPLHTIYTVVINQA